MKQILDIYKKAYAIDYNIEALNEFEMKFDEDDHRFLSSGFEYGFEPPKSYPKEPSQYGMEHWDYMTYSSGIITPLDEKIMEMEPRFIKHAVILKYYFFYLAKKSRGFLDEETTINFLSSKMSKSLSQIGISRDKKLFYDVGKRLDREGHNSNQKQHYFLRDIISCPCGTPMNCKGGDKDLYICRNQERTYQKRKKVCDDCVPMRSVKMSKMDEFIWETLLHTLTQSSLIKEGIKKEVLGKKSTYGKRSIRTKLKSLMTERENLDSMRLELEKDYYSGKMDKERYTVLVGSVNERDIPSGFTGHNEEGVRHQVTNIGDKSINILLIEHKNVGSLLTLNPADELSPEVVFPDKCKLLFENSMVKVLEGTLSVGESNAMHEHGAYATYFVKGGKLEITLPDGTKKEKNLPDGATGFSKDIVRHRAKNIGDTNIKTIIMQYK